jgi:hypothetical protein
LLMVKPVNDIAGGLVRRNVLGHIVRNQGESRLAVAGREAVVRSAIERLGCDIDGTTIDIELREVIECILQAIDTWKLSVEGIEAPVFLVDNDDVLDLFEVVVSRFGRWACLQAEGSGQRSEREKRRPTMCEFISFAHVNEFVKHHGFSAAGRLWVDGVKEKEQARYA